VQTCALPISQPTFATFSLNKTELARGDVLEVSRQATDVATVRLSLDGTPVAVETDPQRVSFSVDTQRLSGEVQVMLEGINGKLSDRRSATVFVYEPMYVEQFEVIRSEERRVGQEGRPWRTPATERHRT